MRCIPPRSGPCRSPAASPCVHAGGPHRSRGGERPRPGVVQLPPRRGSRSVLSPRDQDLAVPQQRRRVIMRAVPIAPVLSHPGTAAWAGDTHGIHANVKAMRITNSMGNRNDRGSRLFIMMFLLLLQGMVKFGQIRRVGQWGGAAAAICCATSGSNRVPAPSRTICSASSGVMAPRCGRAETAES